MKRRQVELVCGGTKRKRHNKPEFLGVLYPPTRAPATQADYADALEANVEIVRLLYSSWSEAELRAEAENLTRAAELMVTRLACGSTSDVGQLWPPGRLVWRDPNPEGSPIATERRRTTPGRWKPAKRRTLRVEGGVFEAACPRCGHVVRWSESAVLERAAAAEGRGGTRIDIAG